MKIYLDRDISQLITLRDKVKFKNLLRVLTSLTGQEFIPDNIAKTIGVNKNTVKAWTDIAVAGDIVTLLSPYYKRTIAAGGKPYKKSQFFKLYKTFYSRSSLRFKNTKTIDQIKAYRLVGRYFESSRMTNSLENLKSEILEFCKKLRLCPQRIF